MHTSLEGISDFSGYMLKLNKQNICYNLYFLPWTIFFQQNNRITSNHHDKYSIHTLKTRMPITFQHQKSEQNTGYTRLLDFDPD